MDDISKKLEYKKTNGWGNKTIDLGAINEYCHKYITFLSNYKTERQAVAYCTELLAQNGFTEGSTNNFFLTHKDKNVGIVRIPNNYDLTKGVNMLVSHLDCPRLDLKPNPLYEDTDLAYLKTHYYGGIKKYQWVSRALAIHGVIFNKEGKRIDVSIGEDDNDPVFFIADLLPHLSHKVQEDKKIKDAITGEQLNVLVGNMPFLLNNEEDKEKKNSVKLNILHLLNEKYGITEEDFTTAEIEIVPAGKARELGFDRSMIGAYGHDDRVCSYNALKAIIDAKNTEKPMMVWLVDKEEIGSDGNTGAKSAFIRQILKQAFINSGQEPSALKIDECLFNSLALSGDVTGAYDPEWKEVFEARNSAKLGYGVSMEKYGGSRGKSGSSDANAEYISKLRKLFNENNIVWQTGELGKVDEGGGGTVAKFLAAYGMEIVDVGTPVLAMHSPMECCSKLDIFMTYKAYKLFLEKA
ncbi:MAG: aminopeptidase [Candidatus Margulisbacteria bacterium]|nr:aminopeptidase [Candidatus Margulisiibacteriota bacterium]